MELAGAWGGRLTLLSRLEEKDPDVEDLAQKASKDEKVLSEIMEGISSGKARIKYGCAKVLRLLAERNPSALYPRWDFFVDMLDSGNTFLKGDGIFILGQLTRVDSEDKIESIFDKLYALLDDESMITAANLIGVSAIIAKAKPEEQSRITSKLLSIDQTHHGSECKNVLKGHAITALDLYFQQSKEKKRTLEFMKAELKNTRPSTRKKAERFLKKWGHSEELRQT
jgi:hypothetical protein